MNAYDHDLYAWSKEQADALRRRATNEIDFENLAQEIEGVGSSERKEIRSRLRVLLIHLLKWRYQPDHQCPSWSASIDEARNRIALTLEDSPSLAAFPGEALAAAYRSALNDRAINHLDTHHLPATCPWDIAQVLDPDFLP
jgi:hypothetical protein